MGVSKTYALVSFALSLYNCCLLNLGNISEEAILSNTQTCCGPLSGFFPQLTSASPLDIIVIFSLTSNASLFGAGLLKMTFGTQYLVYALDYEEPLFAKSKWPAKWHLFGKKIVLNYEDTISEYLKVIKYSLGSAIILERLCLNETSLDEKVKY